MAEPTPPSIAFVVSLFLVFFVALWAGIVLSVSRFSGWAALAKAYPGPPDARPKRWRYQSAYLRFGARYRGVLSFDADAEGFTAAPMWIFRIGHAPLRVPWSDVTAVEETWLFFPFVKLTFSRVPGIPMRIPAGFSRELLAARTDSVPPALAPR